MDMTTITINPTNVIGPVKPMNGVNNGPIKARRDQSRGNFATFRDARIPFARTHDANLFSGYGAPHTVDVTAIFPDFSADVEDPASYDFLPTDHYLEAMVDAGTEVFFRLGESIEHGVRKYNIHPPRDNAKWARICEHIIRHYTEGWADGRKWRMRYWEIWGEPDVWPEGTYGTPFWDARTWGGTSPQFLELYRVAALHLKKCFPHLKIGGPGLGWNWEWAEIFLAYMRAHDVPIDFFSWHIYSTEPREIAARCDRARKTLDKHGYRNAESILDEWNYVKNWSSNWIHSLEVQSGRLNLVSAAYTAATMCACQNKPLDMLMYYDASAGSVMSCLFDLVSLQPVKGYYPFYAWSKLRDAGPHVEARVDWDPHIPRGDVIESDRDDTYAAAAVSQDGRRGAVMVARYHTDMNVTWDRTVRIRLADGTPIPHPRCHLTDTWRTYTEVTPEVDSDGSIIVPLEPRSFALVEW